MTTTKVSAGRERLSELDVLRGLAALAVVLFHYTFRYQQLYPLGSHPTISLARGYLGVQVFFCISGFVIFMTLERTRRPLDFVVSRVSRLWPAYIAAIALTYTVVHLFGLPGRATTLWQALVDLTMVQELLHVPHVDAVYWSLQVELIFYVWMFTAYLTGMLQHARILMLAALVPPVADVILMKTVGHGLPALVNTLVLRDYSPFFVIGLAAYSMYRHGVSARDLAIMGVAVVVAAFTGPELSAPIAIFCALLFWAVATGRMKFIAFGPFIFLGTVSYTLYLTHQNIGYIIIRTLTSHGVSGDLAMVCALALALLVAAALTRLVEKPSLRAIRSLYEKRRPREPATVSYTSV
jgi:peptidoglycan/LPS O-acetylase OafA/YrhL